MKRMIGSICSLAVFLTLFAGLSLPITASAQVSGDFEYYIYRPGTNGVDELAISAYNGTATEVVVPSEIDGCPVVGIGSRAFYECYDITAIELPNTLQYLGYGAFEYCERLQSVDLPNSLMSLSGDVFAFCKSLETITIPDSVNEIGNGLFYYCTSLKNITLPSGITSIPALTFMGCEKLETVTIPSTVTTMGECAFYNCAKLKEITLPSGVTVIEDEAFYGCACLKEIQIPDSVKRIGVYTFSGCKGLKSVIIPGTVTTIGDWAFYNCTSLESVTIGDAVTTIGDGIFAGCDLLESVTVAENNSSYCDVDGVLFTKDMKRMMVYPCGKITQHYTVPDGVCEIADHMFYDIYELRSVAFPKSLTFIGEDVFYGKYMVSDVYYGGSKKNWQQVVIAESNEELMAANVHYNTSETDMSDHWQVVEVVYEPSCEWDGEATYTCDCGYEATRAIPATGHTLRFIETIAPTCDEMGYDVYECTTCWEMVAEDHIPGGHTFENNVCVNCDGAVEECLASAHKYASNTYQGWYVRQEGAKSISLTFSPDTEVEEDCDYLYIYDSEGELFGEYTGTELAGKQITVPGDFAEIVLTSDKSMNYYGFAVTDVCANYGVRGDVDGDGVADLRDLTAVFYHVNAIGKLTEEGRTAADINKDGKVNLADVARLFYIVNELL